MTTSMTELSPQTPNKTRTSDVVDTGEVEALLNLCKNSGLGELQACNAIGYKNPASLLVEMRRVGLVKRVVKYALMGLIDERGLRQRPQAQAFTLTFDEAELLFEALRRARQAGPNLATKLAPLQAKVAQHMARSAQA